MAETKTFEAKVPALLQALRDHVRAKAHDLGPLELTMDGLDRAEQVMERVLAKQLPPPPGGLTEPLVALLGETARALLGGKWAVLEGEHGIKGLRGLPSTYIFTPTHVIDQFHKGRKPGTFREQVGKHDLDDQRARFAQWQAAEAAELAALGAEVEGELDFSVASLDRTEPVLAAAADAGPAGALRRDRVQRYIGEVYRRLGGGAWSLNEDTASADFGRFVVGTLNPRTIASRYVTGRKPGTLRALMEARTKGR